MTDHMPECQRWFTDMPEPDECPACEMFRACELRVLRKEYELDEGDPYREVYRGGYTAGVQAALKVVEPWLENHSPIDDLMNTIGAMRNPPSLSPTTGRALKY